MRFTVIRAVSTANHCDFPSSVSLLISNYVRLLGVIYASSTTMEPNSDKQCLVGLIFCSSMCTARATYIFEFRVVFFLYQLLRLERLTWADGVVVVGGDGFPPFRKVGIHPQSGFNAKVDLTFLTLQNDHNDNGSNNSELLYPRINKIQI